MRPVLASSDEAGVTLTEPGVRLAISIVDPVETRDDSDPRLIATFEPAETFSAVPPAIAHLWIAAEGEAETWTAVCAPSQETSTWSITTGEAQDETTIPPWAVE